MKKSRINQINILQKANQHPSGQDFIDYLRGLFLGDFCQESNFYELLIYKGFQHFENDL